MSNTKPTFVTKGSNIRIRNTFREIFVVFSTLARCPKVKKKQIMTL